LPAIHLDRHFWHEGWAEPAREVWLERLESLMKAPRWIMDGNHTDTLPLRLAAADTVIFLDFPTSVCLLRVIRRAVRWFGRDRGDDMAIGCPERIDWAFMTYVWRFARDHRPHVLALLERFPGRVLALRDHRQVAAFVGSVAGETAQVSGDGARRQGWNGTDGA
jgi:adenylate kinase family enzyme